MEHNTIDPSIHPTIKRSVFGCLLGALLFTISVEAQTQITIFPQTQHQEMVGFGAAISWYETSYYAGNNAKDDAINQTMFVESGLDILRIKNWYYPGEGNNNQAAAVKKAVDDARALNPDIQVLLSSWSPPASLKSNGQRENGGTLAKDGSGNFRYADLAAYWVDALNNMGWTPDYLSFQNEPGWSAEWESCLFSNTQGTNASYSIALDTIWNAIKDMPNRPKILASDAENMNSFLNRAPYLENKAYIDINGYHTYDVGSLSAIDSTTTLSRYNKIRDTYGSRPNWMTEFSKEGWDWITVARMIHNVVVEADCSAYIYWKLGWDDASCTDTMLGLTGGGNYIIRPHYYTLKHYAKYVDKGYQRIETGGSTTDVKVSGYLSTDKTQITLVAINKSTGARPISLSHSLSIASSEGYQSVTDNFWQTMTGLDVTQPINLPASSMTTLVLTLSGPYVPAPVAQNGSASTRYQTAVPITLMASGDGGGTLNYSVVSNPASGTLDGVFPNITYLPNNGFSGTDSFTFKANDGAQDSNIATVTIQVDAPPVANNQSATAFFNTAEPITLTGSDDDGDPLAYSIVAGPANGTLGGTAPNVTYTPNTDFSGNDSFTFKVNDGASDSNIATVSLTVLSTANTPPAVDAGADKTVTISAATPWTPAQMTMHSWYDASDTNTITASDGAVSEWRDKRGNGNKATQSDPLLRVATGTETIGGLNALVSQNTNDNHMVFGTPIVLSDYTIFAVMESFTDGFSGSGVTKKGILGNGSNDSYVAGFWSVGGNIVSISEDGTSGGTIQTSTFSGVTTVTSPFLFSIMSEKNITNQAFFNGTQGSALTPLIADTTLTKIFDGYAYGTPWDGKVGEVIIVNTALSDSDRQKIEGYLAHKWGTATRLPSDHPYESAAPLEAGFATATSDATVSDADADPLTTTWTVVGKQPADAPDPTFSDVNLVNATATFRAEGIYTLRLTANDGRAQTSDEVVITVTSTGMSIYNTWAETNGLTGVNNTAPEEDHDGDGLTNLQEFAFGMNPTSSASNPLSYTPNGTTVGSTLGGTPVLENTGTTSSPNYRAVFVRRKDHAAAGLIYQVQFSANLTHWEPALTAPEPVTGENQDAVETVAVPFPLTIPLVPGGESTATPKFFRVAVSMP